MSIDGVEINRQEALRIFAGADAIDRTESGKKGVDGITDKESVFRAIEQEYGSEVEEWDDETREEYYEAYLKALDEEIIKTNDYGYEYNQVNDDNSFNPSEFADAYSSSAYNYANNSDYTDTVRADAQSYRIRNELRDYATSPSIKDSPEDYTMANGAVYHSQLQYNSDSIDPQLEGDINDIIEARDKHMESIDNERNALNSYREEKSADIENLKAQYDEAVENDDSISQDLKNEKDASDENIANQQAVIDGIQESIEGQKTTIEDANKAVGDQQKVVDGQDETVRQAKETLDGATLKLDAAVIALGNASTALQTAQENYDKASEEDKQSYANALAGAQKAYRDAERDHSLAEEAKRDAEKKLGEKERKLEEEKATLEKKQKELDDAKDDLSKIEGQMTEAEEAMTALQTKATEIDNEIANATTNEETKALLEQYQQAQAQLEADTKGMEADLAKMEADLPRFDQAISEKRMEEAQSGLNENTMEMETGNTFDNPEMDALHNSQSGLGEGAHALGEELDNSTSTEDEDGAKPETSEKSANMQAAILEDIVDDFEVGEDGYQVKTGANGTYYEKTNEDGSKECYQVVVDNDGNYSVIHTTIGGNSGPSTTQVTSLNGVEAEKDDDGNLTGGFTTKVSGVNGSYNKATTVDENGNIVSQTITGDNDAFEYTINQEGKVLSSGGVKDETYDDGSLKIDRTVNDDGTITEVEYNENGKETLTRIIDPIKGTVTEEKAQVTRYKSGEPIDTVTTSITTNPDGSKTETKTYTYKKSDGTEIIKINVTNPDGSHTHTETTINPDGSRRIEKTDSEGNKTVTNIDADGEITQENIPADVDGSANSSKSSTTVSTENGQMTVIKEDGKTITIEENNNTITYTVVSQGENGLKSKQYEITKNDDGTYSFNIDEHTTKNYPTLEECLEALNQE